MHFLVSSHPRIPMFMCTCVHPCIPSHPQDRVVCLYPCIFTSSYPQVLKCLRVSLHLCVIMFLMFMCAGLGPCIFASSYTQVPVYLLVFLHPYILVYSSLCVFAGMLTSSDQCVLDTNRMNNCILSSLCSLVVSNLASHVVSNLQILWAGQAFVLDLRRTSSRIYRKLSLREKFYLG